MWKENEEVKMAVIAGELVEYHLLVIARGTAVESRLELKRNVAQQFPP